MTNMDLNLDNYSLKDIENLFSLSGNYTPQDIEFKEYEMKTRLFKTQMESNHKSNLVKFLNDVKVKLLRLRFSAPLSLSHYESDNNNNNNNHVIQPHPNTQYVHGNPSEFFAGDLNPLNTRILIKQVSIDTKFRENYLLSQSSDFTLHLPERIPNVVSMTLSAIELPLTYNSISQKYGNNHLYIAIDYLDIATGVPSNTWIIVVAPDGNYNAANLIDHLNTDMHSFNTNTNFIFNYMEFALTLASDGSGIANVVFRPLPIYAANVQQVTIDLARNTDGTPDFYHNVSNIKRSEYNQTLDGQRHISTTLGWLLGFRQVLYEGNVLYTGEAVIDPCPQRYFYLCINDYHNSVNNNFVAVIQNAGFDRNVLARIPIDTPFTTTLVKDETSLVIQPRKYFGPVTMEKLQIQLYNDQGRIIDMNYGDFSFSLKFQTLYDL